MLFNIKGLFGRITDVPRSFFSRVADALNYARGENGATVKRGPNGGLVVSLGDRQYSMRTITTCEPTFSSEGGAPVLVFRQVRCLAALADGTPQLLPVMTVSGTEEEAGGGIAAPVEIGGDGEGGPLGEGDDDDAIADTYDPAQEEQDGLHLWVVSRVRYDDEAETPVLYAYFRRLTWPQACAPLVSAETRVEIEVPELDDGGLG